MKVLYYENIINESYKTFEFEKGTKVSEIIEKIGYPQANYIILVGRTLE